jgi:hypothetical protein
MAALTRVTLLISLTSLALGNSLAAAYAVEGSSVPDATEQSSEVSSSVSATVPTETGPIASPPISALPTKKVEAQQPWCPAARSAGSGAGFCLINETRPVLCVPDASHNLMQPRVVVVRNTLTPPCEAISPWQC